MKPSHILPGSVAITRARSAKIADDLGAKTVRALNFFYVKSATQLSQDGLDKLRQLLAYGDPPSEADALTQQLVGLIENKPVPASEAATVFFVAPRLGTISPWSGSQWCRCTLRPSGRS